MTRLPGRGTARHREIEPASPSAAVRLTAPGKFDPRAASSGSGGSAEQDGGPIESKRPAARVTGTLAGRGFDFLLLLATAGILIFQLCVPPIVGLADDGDFARILVPLGIEYPTQVYQEMYWSHITAVYRLVPPVQKVRYLSAETFLAAVARAFTMSIGRRDFDIRVLGCLHIAIFLWATWLILLPLRPLPLAVRAVAGGLLIFVFTDVSFVAPFNSFYSQTAALLAFLVAAGMAANALARTGPARFRYLFGYWIAAAMLLLSKPQESVHAPGLALIGLLLMGKSRRERAVGLAAGALLCVAGYFYYASTPPELSGVGRYFALFSEILPNSPDPARDLGALGLPKGWVKYENTNPYAATSVLRDAAFQRRFRRFSARRLLGFYGARPRRLERLLARGFSRAFITRPFYLGNFTAASGMRGKARSRAFALWSDGEAALVNQGKWLLPMLLAGCFAGGLSGFFRSPNPARRRAWLAAALLAAMAALEFTVVMLAQGMTDLDRHLYTFHAMLDLSLIIVVTTAVAAAVGRSRAPARTAN